MAVEQRRPCILLTTLCLDHESVRSTVHGNYHCLIPARLPVPTRAVRWTRFYFRPRDTRSPWPIRERARARPRTHCSPTGSHSIAPTLAHVDAPAGRTRARERVPQTAVCARSLQHLQMSLFSCVRARPPVPRTAVFPQPLQHLEMPASCRICSRSHIIPAAVLSRPL